MTVCGFSSVHDKHDDCPGVQPPLVTCEREYEHPPHLRSWGMDMVARCPGLVQRFCGITDEHYQHVIDYGHNKPQSVCYGVDPNTPRLELDGKAIIE